MNYTQYIAQLSTETAIPSSDTNFVTIVPAAINYAEGRIYRELDMLVANVRDSSASTSLSSRNFNLPTTVGTFVIVDAINIITPASTAPETGTRNPLTPVSLNVLDTFWPSSTGATVPQMFAYVSQNTYLTGDAAQSQVVFGPWPDATYRVEVVGKIQPAALSASNPNTYLTDNLYDLFFAASMVFMSGYMKNWSAMADDPKSAQSWEGQYEKLRESAATYEARKRFAGASWSPKQPEPTAVPQRG
jgi:hypothetical protein